MDRILFPRASVETLYCHTLAKFMQELDFPSHSRGSQKRNLMRIPRIRQTSPRERAGLQRSMPSVASRLTLSLLPALATGHGSVITPRSRNSVDYLVGINTPKDWSGDRECTNISSNGQGCHNGQAAFYYSQGCFIGCKACDHLSGRRQIDLCGLGKLRTIDPKYRTLNRNATPGSDLDIYRHNPWAAPGTAPVADACGLAGGTPWPQEVSEAGDYTTTAYAHHGMNGTALPPLQTGVKWKVGGVAEVTWQIENHHGGGYQYRLCPAREPLTEACFQRTPLAFATEQQGIVFKVRPSPRPERGPSCPRPCPCPCPYPHPWPRS